MTSTLKKVIFDRIVESVVVSVVMSAFICLLCVTGAMPVGSLQRDIALVLLPLAYIIWNFRTLRKCYIIIDGDTKLFYVSNLCTAVIFCGISMIAFVMLPRKAYSWFFLVTYLMRFTEIGITSPISIILFHVILTISIFLAPIGLGWVKIKAMERRELREMAPGILEVNPLEQKRDSTEVQTNEIQKTKEKDSLS